MILMQVWMMQIKLAVVVDMTASMQILPLSKILVIPENGC